MKILNPKRTTTPAPPANRRYRRPAGVLATLALVGLSLAACGGPSKARSSPTESGSSGSLQSELVKYAACMRSNGIADFPDPTPQPNGLPGFSIHASGNSDLSPQSPKYESATRRCKKDMPTGGDATPAQQAAANTKALKYAQCMRTHGEPNFPDPNGKGVIAVTNATGILNPSAPQFQRSQRSCRDLDNGFQTQMSGGSSGKAGTP